MTLSQEGLALVLGVCGWGGGGGWAETHPAAQIAITLQAVCPGHAQLPQSKERKVTLAESSGST